MTGIYAPQKHLLKDPRLTVKERQALRHPGNIGNVVALCAEISMKLPQRLRYQDLPEDNKGTLFGRRVMIPRHIHGKTKSNYG